MSRREKAILPMLLNQLRLPTIHRQWEEIAIEAESKGWSMPQYLSTLCELEIAEREGRRFARHMSEALLPKGKTIENYDFDAVTNITKNKVLAIASGATWIKEGMNVLIFGSSGVGKTHLAAAIGERLVEN
jgi:DNA replication protein DnaC